MKKTRAFLMAVALVLVSNIALAQEIGIVRTEDDERFKYVVKGGDTLWDISARKLKNPWDWPKIWEQNTDVVEDPHWIYPGEVLYIIPPEELLRRKLRELPIDRLKGPDDAEAVGPGGKIIEDIISWTGPKSLTYAEAATQGFFETDDIEHLASIISSFSEKKYLSENDRVLTNLTTADGVKLDDTFTIYRHSEKMRHPMTKKKIGWRVIILGVARITEVTDDDASAVIEVSFQEILIGDRLRAYKEEPVEIEFLTLSESDPDINGYILYSKENLHYFGNNQVIYIDVGENQGVKTGMLFEVYKPGDVIKDKKHKRKIVEPDETLGMLVVLSVQKNTSTTLAYKGTQEFEPGEYIRAIKQKIR